MILTAVCLGIILELLRHGRIITTKARAKAMRKPVEHMITLAKRNTLHSRRQALSYIYDEQLVHSLFEAVGERYGDRNGTSSGNLYTFNCVAIRDFGI